MKKLICIFAVVCFSTLSMVSCIDMTIETFDENLLYGKWQSGTLYYKYISDGSGTTWDTADDVTEAEAQAFSWTLVNDELTHIYILEIGGSVPKIYTVTELTATSLTYEDDFGKVFTFSKVN